MLNLANSWSLICYSYKSNTFSGVNSCWILVIFGYFRVIFTWFCQYLTLTKKNLNTFSIWFDFSIWTKELYEKIQQYLTFLCLMWTNHVEIFVSICFVSFKNLNHFSLSWFDSFFKKNVQDYIWPKNSKMSNLPKLIIFWTIRFGQNEICYEWGFLQQKQ